MEIAIRAYEPSDKNFVYSTVLRGLYYGNEFYNQIEQDVYYRCYQSVIDALLAKPGTEVRVACLADEPSVILGFAVLTPAAGVLHYVFTKDAFRKQGLAKRLVASTEINFVTHITKPGNAIRKKNKWAFNPFLI